MTITLPPKPVTKPLTRVAVMALAVQRSGLTAQQIETTPAGRAAWIRAAGELARSGPCKLVERANHLAVHGLFDSRATAEKHLANTVPEYVRRGYFMDKTLTAESFEIIS